MESLVTGSANLRTPTATHAYISRLRRQRDRLLAEAEIARMEASELDLRALAVNREIEEVRVRQGQRVAPSGARLLDPDSYPLAEVRH